MRKNRDKKIDEQQARPTPEDFVPEEKNIPVREETAGQEIKSNSSQTPTDGAQTQQDEPQKLGKSQTAILQDTGEKTTDTPEKQRAVFECEDWKSSVEKFFTDYPLAKRFAAQIGKEIAEDESLHTDCGCLEKALLRVLCREYVAPENLVKNDDFLRTYVYADEAIKQAIVDEYLDNLQKSMPVRAISSGGQISLTPPSRPKSIEEAGAVIRTMLNNRRI